MATPQELVIKGNLQGLIEMYYSSRENLSGKNGWGVTALQLAKALRAKKISAGVEYSRLLEIIIFLEASSNISS
jgi:hypothetical protein